MDDRWSPALAVLLFGLFCELIGLFSKLAKLANELDVSLGARLLRSRCSCLIIYATSLDFLGLKPIGLWKVGLNHGTFPSLK